MNAASPATQTLSESHSLYPTTPGGGDRTTPVRRPWPRPDRLRIVHGDRLVLLNDSPATFGGLPFQRIAGQHFVSRPLPYKTPKLFLTLSSFASLNPSRHSLQLIPGPGWLTISILSQKVGAIKQKPDVDTIRHSHQLLIHGVACGYVRKLKGYFVGEIWLEIYEVFVQNPRPDHIDPVNVRTRGAGPEELFPQSPPLPRG